MVVYEMKCPEGHIFEMELADFMTAASYLRTNPACKECFTTGCVKYFRPGGAPPVIYNAPGFYGNVPTMDAHATRNM